MKKLMRLCVLVLMALLVLAGCGMSDEEFLAENEDTALVVIAGRHANANWYTAEMLEEMKIPELIDRTMEFSVKENSEKPYWLKADTKFIVPDKNPQIAQMNVDGQGEYVYNTYDAEKALNARSAMTEAYLDFLTGADLVADDEQVDLNAAISEAATYLRSSGKTNLEIVILDPGLCTSGIMTMQGDKGMDLMTESAQEILDRMEYRGLPDLTGISVRMFGIGNVGGAQIDYRYNEEFKTRLVGLWNEYFQRCHAVVKDRSGNEGSLQFHINTSKEGKTMQHFAEGELGEADQEMNYPKVDPIIFQISHQDPTAQELVFRSDTLGFRGDSSELPDQDRAVAALQSMSEMYWYYLNEYPGCKLKVIGSIAMTVPNERPDSSDTSRDRARIIAELLVNSLGFPADRVQIIDAGAVEFSWRNAEEFPDGAVKQDRTAAKENRVVAVIPDCLTDIIDEIPDQCLERAIDYSALVTETVPAES